MRRRVSAKSLASRIELGRILPIPLLGVKGDSKNMKVLKYISWKLSRKKEKTFEELSSWFVAPIGALAFLAASYPGVMFTEVVPEFVETINRVGLDTTAVKIAFILGIYAIAAWCFGCIAAKCHSVLYERWFR